MHDSRISGREKKKQNLKGTEKVIEVLHPEPQPSHPHPNPAVEHPVPSPPSIAITLTVNLAPSRLAPCLYRVIARRVSRAGALRRTLARDVTTRYIMDVPLTFAHRGGDDECAASSTSKCAVACVHNGTAAPVAGVGTRTSGDNTHIHTQTPRCRR
jgi:hypothetical protein